MDVEHTVFAFIFCSKKNKRRKKESSKKKISFKLHLSSLRLLISSFSGLLDPRFESSIVPLLMSTWPHIS